MNGIQLNALADFNPLQPKERSPFQILNFLIGNILTLGIGGTVNSLIHQRHIRKLEIKQEQLFKSAADLAEDWKGLAQRLIGLQNELSANQNPDVEGVNNKILRLKEKFKIFLKTKMHFNKKFFLEDRKEHRS